MFYYYGSKSKIINLYPKPKYDIVVEPFAGTAQYALLNYTKKCIINEKYDVVYKIWKYLQSATPCDILSLPKLYVGNRLSDMQWPCEEAKALAGFIINNGSTCPKNTVMAFVGKHKDGLCSNWEFRKKQISKDLYKIKDWDIRLGDYKNIEVGGGSNLFY